MYFKKNKWRDEKQERTGRHEEKASNFLPGLSEGKSRGLSGGDPLWGAGRGRFPSDRGGAPDQQPKWGCFGGHFCIFAGWKHFLLQSANLTTRKALLVSGRRTTWHPFPAGDAGVRVRPLRNLFLVRTENRTSPNHFNTLLTLHISPQWAKRWALSILQFYSNPRLFLTGPAPLLSTSSRNKQNTHYRASALLASAPRRDRLLVSREWAGLSSLLSPHPLLLARSLPSPQASRSAAQLP